ncbi:MAG: helix-turn-helix transcriptional regulator [Candidatus Omnitrophota bacterium]|nr:helix-turn-helix transcriptional regulator [Candidatus Omnitrophota bacterium]
MIIHRMASQARKKLAKRIKELRKKRRFTQEEAAEKAGIKYKYYQEMESTNPRDMKFSTLEKIAKGLGVPLSQLFKFK